MTWFVQQVQGAGYSFLAFQNGVFVNSIRPLTW